MRIIKIKIKPTFIVSLLFLLALSSACMKQKSAWKGTIEVENGVTVVNNPKEPIYDEEAFTLEEELSIGEAEGSEEYMFSRIRSIAIDKEENVFVADSQEINIKAFDRNGNFLRTIGRAGQGPGEFGRPYDISITKDDELMVSDGRYRKVLYYSLDGEFRRYKNLGSVFPYTLDRDSSENYYVMTWVREPPNSRFELLKLDSEMNHVATLAESPLPDSPEPTNPFAPIIHYSVMSDDSLLYGYPVDYELQIISPEGKVLKKITKEYDPVPVTEDEKNRVRSQFQGSNLKFSKYHSAYRGFTADDEGRIFVSTYEKTEDEESYFYDVFDPEGKYVAKILLKIRPRLWKKGKLYTIEEDEEGYQIVKRYKVNWKIQ